MVISGRLKLMLLLGSCLLGMTRLTAIRSNAAYLLVSFGISGQYDAAKSTRLLAKALSLQCGRTEPSTCDPGLSDRQQIITQIDQLFMYDLEPMQIVTESSSLPVATFKTSGLPDSLAENSASGTLFGPGYFVARLNFLIQTASCFQVLVRAQHDNPPPVLIELWLDDSLRGTYVLEKGDQSWETLSLTTLVQPRTYWFRLYFANDYIDPTSGDDRNLYVEAVSFQKVERHYCEGD